MELPTIKPEWRTSTVIQLCQSMREAQDYGALPILADALQEADCDDQLLLDWLRSPTGEVYDSLLVALILMPEEVQSSLDYMKELAAEIGTPYSHDYEYDDNGQFIDNGHSEGKAVSWEDLMEVAHSVNSKNNRGWDDYIHMGQNEQYKRCFWGHTKEFWRHYQRLTGERIRDDDATFFSCSC